MQTIFRILIASILFIASLGFLFFKGDFAYAQVAPPTFSNANPQSTEYEIPYCPKGVNCSINGGIEASKKSLENKGIETKKELSAYIQELVAYALTFVSIIAVIYIIWSGFKILTSGGNEDEVSKTKKTITHIIIGIVVMWLAYSIVSFIINGILQGKKTAHTHNNNTFLAQLIPTANAQRGAYTENESGTFLEYKSLIQAAIEDLETELRINGNVSVANIQKIKSLLQQAADRLPDKDSTISARNQSSKKAVDMYLGIAMAEPTSQQKVGDAISKVASFINSVQVQQVQGSILATPTEGNAPLTVSFRAQNIKDPSGTIPPASNHIWWIRENGGVRRELGRGVSLTQTFTNEGTYTVFLDVVSASKNSKGKTDILPLSSSVQIEVKPKIAEVVLLVNGNNVSNQDYIKVSPLIGGQGIVFDATASRAIGNGKINETKWDFGNGNTRTYKGPPRIEREIFATQGNFTTTLEFKTNEGLTFSKTIQIAVIDPAATINVDKTTGFVGENFSFSAENRFSQVRNVEYIWQIQSENGKKTVKSTTGLGFNHTFDAIGEYIVTLTAKNPNGSTDSDSKIITIESRPPIASLDTPVEVSLEKPNTFVFNASRSYDPDTNSRKDLTYTWRINDQKVSLNNPNEDGSKGEYTFENTGESTVSVTVANKYGKVDTKTQTFTVRSTLAGNLIIRPQVTQVGKEISLLAQSSSADFYEWNMGDGSQIISGDQNSISHIYKVAGSYQIQVRLMKKNSDEVTTLNRKIFVTNADSPFALIEISNSSNSAILEPGACDGHDAYVLNRAEATTINGANSINVDGNIGNLDYTWRYMGRISTNQSLSDTFKELGCYPITLTVRSKTTGATHTSTQYIQLKNQPPKLTSITTALDNTKKDSQKIVVKANVNGATDIDGVITSYTWFYTTESDSEPQSLQITQSPSMIFVLPNITEKYFFGVIIEDNDGARVNSMQLLQGQTPLIVDNSNGNINLPLISLSTPNKPVKVGEKIRLSVQAKTIMGTNITNKSQYAWDFDGDGTYDARGSEPTIDHTYTNAGDFGVRVRVTHNGVSNTKYSTIIVKNELKASYIGFRIPGDKIYLMNTSQGVYESTNWKIGDFRSSDNDGVVIDFQDIPSPNSDGSIGMLTVSNGDSEVSTVNISSRDLNIVEAKSTGSGITIQSSLPIENNTIKISNASEKLRLSFFGNNATNFAIDTDTNVDSDLDGIPDNDIDNKNTASYSNGSAFTIADFGYSQKRNRTIKITTYKNNNPIATQNINLLLDFIPEIKESDIKTQTPGLANLSAFDKTKLEEFEGQIRNLPESDRIILMQKYRNLVENWGIDTERAKNLYDMDRIIRKSGEIPENTKTTLSETIEALLMRGADTTNKIQVSLQLLKSLISPENPNYKAISERLDTISSHPNDITTNKKLGSEILEMIQKDKTLEDSTKLIFKEQLTFVTTQEVATPENPTVITKKSENTGILGTFGNILKIAGIILGIVLLLMAIAYGIYRSRRKEGDTGFQDYIIDSVKGEKKQDAKRAEESIIPRAEAVTAVQTKESNETISSSENIDPLKSYTPPEEVTHPKPEPIPEMQAPMPDWMKPPTETTIPTIDPLSQPENTNTISPSEQNSSEQNNNGIETGGLPDWLNPNTTPVSASTETISNAFETQIPPENINTQNNIQNIESENNPENTQNGGLPDWLQTGISENTVQETQIPETETAIQSETIAPESNQTETENSEELPAWLQSSTTKNSQTESIDNNFSYTESKLQNTPNENFENTKNATSDNTEIPSWLQELGNENTTNDSENDSQKIVDTPPSEELPDWLVSSAENLETVPQILPNENANETTKAENPEKPSAQKTKNEKKETESKGIESIEKKSSKVKKKQTTSQKTNKQTEENVDIPDWLK